MRERVSVIVPVYNAQKYLVRCVDSILAQTHKDLEIILVDDGSTDNSPKLCKEFAQKDSRIKVIHKQNEGAGMARNMGLQEAAGEFVMFVDSDDYIESTTIEKSLTVRREYNADLVMFGRFNQTADGKITPKPMTADKCLFEGDEVVSKVLSGLFTYKMGVGISCWGKVYDINLIKGSNISFNSERELLSEDAFFMLQLFKHIKRVALLPESLYYYCQNENSLSRGYKKGRQALCDNFLLEGSKVCSDLHYPATVLQNFKARYLMYVISGLKRIVGANLKSREKKQELFEIFKNCNLHKTLTRDVLSLLNGSSRLFWYLLKLGCYNICYLLLCYKSSK